ncbi:Hsp20/alpha crystallin family protein [Micromonospora sp. WMMD987]|jgi:HSP20 family protein|uniref:Hsp20/alpha crystallin family protein n=1 Tax=Micromonospora TaxID=1873 RepID=UPI00249CDE75|nr:Hsp20/alpha crystallin family protein [Micromonospora sp. WMMD987]WFE92828.1 Hsp20/alpha crystallin family protein [Micromonospora sp. WMMD987]
MLMRTDPFREIDRLAEQLLGTTSRPAVMHLDAWRDGDHFHAAFDLPGVDPDSIDCTVERNVLTVRAQRRRPTSDAVELVAAERPMGTFSRQLFLGDTLDTDRLEAAYEHGVLTLRIPIAERAKPRRVPVTAGNGRRQLTTA